MPLSPALRPLSFAAREAPAARTQRLDVRLLFLELGEHHQQRVCLAARASGGETIRSLQLQGAERVVLVIRVAYSRSARSLVGPPGAGASLNPLGGHAPCKLASLGLQIDVRGAENLHRIPQQFDFAASSRHHRSIFPTCNHVQCHRNSLISRAIVSPAPSIPCHAWHWPRREIARAAPRGEKGPCFRKLVTSGSRKTSAAPAACGGGSVAAVLAAGDPHSEIASLATTRTTTTGSQRVQLAARARKTSVDAGSCAHDIRAGGV